VYETAPLGIEDQPDFLNAVATGVTELKPRALLTRMHEVERECGRRRTVAGGPRTLDLDLVFYGDHVIRSRRLTVPHPRWRTRAFVCVPLAEIEPDRIDPESGTRVDEACGTLSTVGIRRFAGPSALENGS
jgi:2-amino-4-hydroxy-6-hydroxymethyldihydropteridine diphosphokinase